MPIYKVEKYLNRCVDSILVQTYRDLEVILIDDGSPDGCGAICDAYAAQHDRVTVIHKKNGGLSSARNAGLEVCSGSYIYFVDADDYVSAEAIEILLRHAERTSADITVANYALDKEGELFPNPLLETGVLQPAKMSSAEKFRYFFGRNVGTSAWNKLYKKAFLLSANAIFEPNDTIYAEDLLFNLKLFVNNPLIATAAESTYYYRHNVLSITRQPKARLPQRMAALVDSFIAYSDKIQASKSNLDLVNYLCFNVLDACCYDASQRNGPHTAWSETRVAIRLLLENRTIRSAIESLARGEHLRTVPRRDWRWQARAVSWLCSINAIGLAAGLQVGRFAIRKAVGKFTRPEDR